MATAEQWQQVQELFHEALEQEPAERLHSDPRYKVLLRRMNLSFIRSPDIQ